MPGGGGEESFAVTKGDATRCVGQTFGLRSNVDSWGFAEPGGHPECGAGAVRQVGGPHGGQAPAGDGEVLRAADPTQAGPVLT